MTEQQDLFETEPRSQADMNRGRKGDFAEFYAVTWLWDQGYEVFLNAGCTGPVDLIATKDGKATLVDVKTRCRDKKNGKFVGRARTDLQKEMGVRFVVFNPDTRGCHWVEHRV